MRLDAVLTMLGLALVSACDSLGAKPMESTAFIEGQVSFASDCHPQASKLVARGTWDIGSEQSAADCPHAYPIQLAVQNAAFISTQAELTLRRADGTLISFEVLANPFTQALGSSQAGGEPLVAMGSIPSSYAQQLRDVVGDSILLETVISFPELRVPATPTFTFSVDICAGCLTHCRSELTDEAELESLFPFDTCRNNSGSDDRVCIDADC